jgi:transcription initiation factor IIE alpha subunit
MSITERILDIIENSPNISAEDIRTKAEVRVQTVKSTLWRLYKEQRIVREKVKKAAIKGPQSIYVYSLAVSNKPENETVGQ